MAITRVQGSGKVTGGTGAGGTFMMTLPAPPTAGNGIIVQISAWYGTVPITSVTDNRGNTYVQAVSAFAGGGTEVYAAIWYCSAVVTTGSPFTITVTFSGNQFYSAAASEVTGGITVEKTTSAVSATGTTWTTGSTAALTVADVYVAATLTTRYGATSLNVQAVSPPWVLEYTEPGATNVSGRGDSRSLTSVLGSTQSCTWTSGGGTSHAVGVLVAFKAVTPLVVAHTTWYMRNSLTSPAINTTGATLIVVGSSRWGYSMAAPVDNKGNTYVATPVSMSDLDGNSQRAQLWYCLAPVTGSGHTFTIATSPPGDDANAATFVAAFSKPTTPVLDTTQQVAGTAPISLAPYTAPSGGALTVVVNAHTSATGIVAAPVPPYVVIDSVGGGGFMAGGLAAANLAASASVTTSITAPPVYQPVSFASFIVGVVAPPVASPSRNVQTDAGGSLRVTAATPGAFGPPRLFGSSGAATNGTGQLKIAKGTAASTFGPLTNLGNLPVRVDAAGVMSTAVRTIGTTFSPLTALPNLRCRLDANGALCVAIKSATAPNGPLTKMSSLMGRTDENGSLIVTEG